MRGEREIEEGGGGVVAVCVWGVLYVCIVGVRGRMDYGITLCEGMDGRVRVVGYLFPDFSVLV